MRLVVTLFRHPVRAATKMSDLDNTLVVPQHIATSTLL